jgi:hypothetical protein
MTLEKAIEISKLSQKGTNPLADDLKHAHQLGIEALERIQNIRKVGNTLPGSLLPSEEVKL